VYGTVRDYAWVSTCVGVHDCRHLQRVYVHVHVKKLPSLFKRLLSLKKIVFFLVFVCSLHSSVVYNKRRGSGVNNSLFESVSKSKQKSGIFFPLYKRGIAAAIVVVCLWETCIAKNLSVGFGFHHISG